jgi:hypothetical protein
MMNTNWNPLDSSIDRRLQIIGGLLSCTLEKGAVTALKILHILEPLHIQTSIKTLLVDLSTNWDEHALIKLPRLEGLSLDRVPVKQPYTSTKIKLIIFQNEKIVLDLRFLLSTPSVSKYKMF